VNYQSRTLKIDKSKLGKEKAYILYRLFAEAKWYYNHFISQDFLNKDIRNELLRKQSVDVLNKKENKSETRELKFLGRRLKAGIWCKVKSAIKGLSAKKKKGGKVGKLKFKKEANSIYLEAYPHAFELKLEKMNASEYFHYGMVRIEIRGKNELKKRGLWLDVIGTSQIPVGAKIVTGELIKSGDDFYIKVVFENTIQKKEDFELVGVDLGLKNQLTFSNGIQVAFDSLIKKIDKNEKILKNASVRFSRKKKFSKNFFKQKDKIAKIHRNAVSLKNSNRRLIINALIKSGVLPVFQNDNIAGWQRENGKKISKIALSEIRSSFVRIAKEVGLEYEKLDRFEATTQICSECGERKIGEDKLDRGEDTFECGKCGHKQDRDFNAARNILNGVLKQIPGDTGKFKPVENKTSAVMLNNLRAVPNISVSLCSTKQESPYRVSSSPSMATATP